MAEDLQPEELELLLSSLDGSCSTVSMDAVGASASFCLVAALVNRGIRVAKFARNPVERGEAAAFCATIREILSARRRQWMTQTPAIESQSQSAAAPAPAGHEPDGVFIQGAYEAVLRRGATANDIQHWVKQLASGVASRETVLLALAEMANAEIAEVAKPNDSRSCTIMGTQRSLHMDDWLARADALRLGHSPALEAPAATSRFHLRPKQPRVLVSAITSLYRGAEFIEQFMENITSQTVFDDWCELIIIDAASPDNEAEVIRRYFARHENIRYRRVDCRIGIYEAWNLGVESARGEYLTSTNVDDLRRQDSFELQAAVLDNLDFVDVVYQDFYYSFDPKLSVEQVAAFGYKSDLPSITPYNMMAFNSPHNGPMWRRRLHDELGLFDSRYRSAGDYEFWMRCLAAGKTFYKLNDPHVVYYQNPKGLSTQPQTHSIAEARNIHQRYCRRLTSPHLTSRGEVFASEVLDWPASLGGEAGDPGKRYALVQERLRQLAWDMKFTNGKVQ